MRLQIIIRKRVPARARSVWCEASLSSSGRLVLSDLTGAGNRQMVIVSQDHIVPICFQCVALHVLAMRTVELAKVSIAVPCMASFMIWLAMP